MNNMGLMEGWCCNYYSYIITRTMYLCYVHCMWKFGVVTIICSYIIARIVCVMCIG